MISEGCRERFGFDMLTSRIFVGIMGCKKDNVIIPFFNYQLHKTKIGIIIVALDAVSILILLYFFTVIKQLNIEFLNIIDDLRVQMKDFGIKIDNVILDRYTQDSRLIKLKIWLHFTNVLQPYADDHNQMEVIDVCLSLYTQPSIQLVFRMQEIQ